jgi:hypothetical protein
MQMIGLSSSTLTMFGLFWDRREDLRIKSGQQGAASKRFAGEFLIPGAARPRRTAALQPAIRESLRSRVAGAASRSQSGRKGTAAEGKAGNIHALFE